MRRLRLILFDYIRLVLYKTYLSVGGLNIPSIEAYEGSFFSLRQPYIPWYCTIGSSGSVNPTITEGDLSGVEARNGSKNKIQAPERKKKIKLCLRPWTLGG